MNDEFRCDDRRGVLKHIRTPIRADQVLRIQGYRDLSKVRPVIRETAEAIAKKAEHVMMPEIHYRRLDVISNDGAELILEDGIRLNCPAFSRILPSAKQVVVAITTMGQTLDQETVAHSARHDLLEALFLETCGWLGINALTARFSALLHQCARSDNCDVTPRMGPGYGYKLNGQTVDWPIEQQKQLFSAFDEAELPVKLNDSCVMLPKMSRSAMFGIIPKQQQGTGTAP